MIIDVKIISYGQIEVPDGLTEKEINKKIENTPFEEIIDFDIDEIIIDGDIK